MISITENPCSEVKYNTKKEGVKSKGHPDARTCKEKMPTIKCMCGATILVVPDLKEMSSAIEKHVAAHKKNCRFEPTQCWAPNNLRQCLIEQLFELTSNDEE